LIGVLIVTHGRLGEALLEAAAMLVSESACLRAVGFQPGEGVEDLDAKVRAALAELAPNDGVLCLADLPGGSPARVLGGLVFERPDLELVTGANLPMLVEILLLRKELSLKELVQHAVQSGAGSIMDIGAILRQGGGSDD
jgi:mannose/fructose/sorbose-specific phosphotransferase system IIA component